MTDINYSRAELALNSHYEILESKWKIEDRVAEYGMLVVPSGNSDRPFHRWFHFKEGYSHALVEKLVAEKPKSAAGPLSILDPFIGSGTTLLSGIELLRDRADGSRLEGVERNPVMHIIAAAKLLGAAKGGELGERVQAAEQEFWSSYERILATAPAATTESATLNNASYFDAASVRSLISLGRAARMAHDEEVRTIFQACVAMSVEPSGKLRRDGRALRFQPNKTVRSPTDAVRSAIARVLEDMKTVESSFEGDVDLSLGDARSFRPDSPRSFDWAIFSPPYPNNIDYTEVYKTEAWALELFQTSGDVRQQRLATLRSHPSVKFADDYLYASSDISSEVAALIEPILEAIPDDRYKPGRTQVVKGYADDMLAVLVNTRSLMAADGRCAIVVGNSSHGHASGQYVIASDLLIAGLAELSGWNVLEIRVARRPKRRKDPHGWLRESVILLECEPFGGGVH